MNITQPEIFAFRKLLTKADKQVIADSTNTSFHTVTACLNGYRPHNEIEQALLRVIKGKIDKLYDTYHNIRTRNLYTEASLIGYTNAKSSTSWSSGQAYTNYLDAYLILVSIKFDNPNELITYLKTNYSHLIAHKYYVIELITKLSGLNILYSIKAYNQFFTLKDCNTET